MKYVIVTGASGGMGRAIVNRCIECGYHVVGIDLVEQAPQQHEQFTYVSASVLDEQKINEIVKSLPSVYGLINAHGIAQSATPIEDVTLEYWEKVMNINAKSLFIMTKAVAPKMKNARDGVIVNIASISAVRPRPGLQAYIASKGAAESFSRAMAIELAPYQVRVNTIHPGPADTGMLGQFVAQGADVEKAKEEIFAQSVPLGRLVQPKDIAEAVVFLLQDSASVITGTTLHVDGGRGL